MRARLKRFVSPLLRIEHHEPPDLTPYAGVIITSANALPALDRAGPGQVPVYCVGDATTQAARQAGMTAHRRGEDAQTLIAALVADAPKTPLLHLRGQHARGDVAVRLTEAGIATDEVIVYDQPLQPLSDEARAVLGDAQPVIVPLFSPRTAGQFRAETDRHGPWKSPLYLPCLSAAVRDALGEAVPGTPILADRPDAATMVAAVGRALNLACRVERKSGPQ